MAQDHKLTRREKEVACLLLEGKSNKQIALILGISESTVEYHNRNIYAKLGVENRAGAVKLLVENPDILGDNPDPSPDDGYVKPETDNKVKDKNPMETIGDIPGDSTVDETGEGTNIVVSNGNLVLKSKNRPHVTPRISLEDIIRFLVSHKFPLILWLLLVLVILVIIWWPEPLTYEREGEYPDEYTVGQVIQRSEASDEMVHGQFGTVPAWPAQPGYVKYDNIKIPRTDHLYLKLRYSKYSASEVPILVYLGDGETEPRATIMPIDQGDWNKFVWTDTIDLGAVKRGVYSIKFYTVGQTYGVADLDVFILTTKPP